MTDARRPRIGLLSAAAADDRRAFSGIVWHVARAVERQLGDVVPLGPAHAPVLELAGRVRNRFRRLRGRNFNYQHTSALANSYARQLRGLSQQPVDLIIAPAAATELSQLPATKARVVYMSDTTFALVNEYYPAISGLPRANVEQANAIERAALHRADDIVFPSAWAAASAERDYGVSPARIHLVPFGANLERAPALDDMMAMKARRNGIALAFIGVEWERKGGAIALEALTALRARGVDAKLTIVGCRPPVNVPEGATVIEHLDKSSAADRERLTTILGEAHLLLLPTRAECSPIVVPEASAHATPSLVTDTGGVRGTLLPGENGVLVPMSAGGGAWAEIIVRQLADRDAHRRLCLSSRAAYDTKLNWDAWARSVGRIAGLT